jgi:carbon-monoxide dehydrogenase large subunit
MKDCIYPEDVLVPYLSVMLKPPIKWVESRQENFLSYHGRGESLEIEMALNRDGSILGMRVRIIAGTGAYFLLTTSSALFNAVRRINGPYRIPAVQVELLAAITNKTHIGAFRGTGGPKSAYCIERTLDLAAKDLGLDPADIRRINFIPHDAFPYQTATGLTYDSVAYEEGLNRVLELADYGYWKKLAGERGPNEPASGIGLATVLKSSGSSGDHKTESARVKIDASGQVTVFTGVSPHGQGSETSFAQIAASESGVEPSQVQVIHGDTSLYHTGIGTSASRGLIVGGSALYSVLQEARSNLSNMAGQLLGCSPAEIRFEGGKVFCPDNLVQGISMAELLAAADAQEMLPGERGTGLECNGSYTLPDSPYSFAAHVVVVEASLDTGQVNILRFVGIHDSGRIINPMLVEGQIHGGIAQGIGQALTQGIVYTPDGQPITASLLDYALPRASQIPELFIENMETPSPTNPLGPKGVGSVSTVAAPVAVADAVLDTPLTPEKIWRAIHDKERHS